MIIVTGANGLLGRNIVERLLERAPAEQIAVSVRDPEKASMFRERGVSVRKGDFNEPETLARAFEGATQVLIVSVNVTGEAALKQHRAAIDAACDAGARRILYTSHMGARISSPFPPMPDHVATEVMLKESGIAFTSLRNGFYASSAIQLLGHSLETGELVLPEDGPVSWTGHNDLAEAAAIALTEEGKLDGITAPLVRTEALDLADVASIASELTGRPIRRIKVSDQDYKARLLSHGVSEIQAGLMMRLFEGSRNGDFASDDPALGNLLGRAPSSVRASLSDVLAKS